MDEGKVSENHLVSAAAFVEGGILEASDDACSICLEDFCDSEPSTVTSCKHEFHLHCILEWCQRSSQCPMCWQSISLKDSGSQELLDAVEHERNMRMKSPRNATIFHHPTLGDFELQHLPFSASESEFEERIIQHLAAAASMGRARHLARREGQRTHSSSPDQLVSTNQHGTSSTNRSPPLQTSPVGPDRAGPSDLQSFSETLKSRLGAFSTRYKESITKSTRGWKERLFARNSSAPPVDPPSAEVHHREVEQDIATVSRMMDHLGIAEDGSRTTNAATVPNNNLEESSNPNPNPSEDQNIETGSGLSLSEGDERAAPCAAGSASN